MRSHVRGRLAVFVAVATMAMSLVACGTETDVADPTGATEETEATGEQTEAEETEAAETEAQQTETEENEATTGEGGLIAIITPSAENPFFKAEADTAQRRAEELGYETSVASHDDDPARQSQLIDNAIAAGAAAIILDNAGADESIGPVQKATDAGIPVFLIDREINATDIAVAQIVANNAQGATLGAEEFVSAMGGQGKYIEFTGRDTDTNAHVRSDSYNAVIGEYEDMELLAQDTANWDQREAFEKMETFIQRFGDEIEGVIAGNDTMAMGVVAALEAAGMIDDVVVVGFDGSPEAVEAVGEGRLHATVLQPAAQMALDAVDQAHEYITTGGTDLPEKQSIDCLLVTADNWDQFGVFELLE
jgi:erythritol transport system substrate-binding protein